MGAYIRARREARGWTQTRLAEESGVDRAYLSQIERGATKVPAADVRRRLADALGVRHIDLLIAAGEIAPSELPGYESAPEGDALDAVLSRLSRDERQMFAELIETAGRQRAAQERRRITPAAETAPSGSAGGR